MLAGTFRLSCISYLFSPARRLAGGKACAGASFVIYFNQPKDPEDTKAMYKNCQTEQSAARQRQVEQRLLQELEQRHYEDITVSDLCQSTGISRKCFYRYFSGKQGVLDALMDHIILQVDIASSIDSRGDQTAGLTVFFHFWKDRRSLLDTLNRSALLDALVNRTVLLYQESYLSQHTGDLTETQSVTLYQIEFLVSGLMRMMLHWYRDGFPLTVEQMAAATMLPPNPLS